MTEPSPGGILLLALVYFFGGISSLLALLFAVSVHELGHIAVIRLFSGRLKGISFGLSGLNISCVGLQNRAALLLALSAGPLSGFALAYAASYYGNLHSNLILLKTAGISFLLSLYNLLPALPMDGGQLLLCLLELAFPKNAELVMLMLGIAVGVSLSMLGAVFLQKSYGPALLFAGICVLAQQKGIVKRLGLL